MLFLAASMRVTINYGLKPLVVEIIVRFGGVKYQTLFYSLYKIWVYGLIFSLSHIPTCHTAIGTTETGGLILILH